MNEEVENITITERVSEWVRSLEGQRDMADAFDTSERLVNYLKEERSFDISSLNTPFNL